MKNRRSLHTLSSNEIRPGWQMPMMANLENGLYQDPFWTPVLTFDPFQASPLYSDTFLYDYNAGGDVPSQNVYLQNVDDCQTTTDDTCEPYDDTTTYVDSMNPTESFCFPEPLTDESQTLPGGIGIPCYNDIPFQPPPALQYGFPVVTSYGSVSLLLRHLVRVDLTPGGSVSVHNFPAMSVITLNAAGNRCYANHPNGQLFQEDSTIHIVTENNRFVRIDHRGIIFSSNQCSLAYVVDESGTKTTTGRFIDLNNDMATTVFYDSNYYLNLEQQCYKMVSEASYQVCPDGSEMWLLGKIRIKQDKWGEVTVVQSDGTTTIGTSPTIRRVNISSPSLSVNIDCFSKNYLTVRKDTYLVTSGCCGLFVQSRSQKAGLDRNGKLVLF